MFSQLRPALAALVWLTLVTGVAYPVLVTAIAQGVFPDAAGGSLLHRNTTVIGSRLIGQSFTSPAYFWSRPSAVAYNGAGSGGSNLGPTNPALVTGVSERIAALQAADPTAAAKVPADLVTTSGSGLDPEISPEGAYYQISRVATARGMDAAELTALVDAHIQPRTLGLLGEPRVNVLELNLALDAL